jgi:hypothetical protein
MDMRFGTWNIRSLYLAGSLMTVSRELSKYKLDLVGIQEVRWDRGGTEPASEYKFFPTEGECDEADDAKGNTAHAPTEDKADDAKGNIYEELVLDKFLKYCMTMPMKAGNTFLSQQLEMRFYTKLVIIMELEL